MVSLTFKWIKTQNCKKKLSSKTHRLKSITRTNRMACDVANDSDEKGWVEMHVLIDMMCTLGSAGLILRLNDSAVF